MADKSPEPGSGVGEGGEWVPAFEGQRPPFEPGNTVAVGHGRPPTHGAKSKRMLKPVAEHYLALLREAAPAGDVPADSFALERLAFRLAQIHLAENWLHERGVVDRHGDPWPLARELVAWETNARKLMVELGLTARSRAELRLDVLRGDLLTVLEVQAWMSEFIRLVTPVVPLERRSELWKLAEQAGEAVDERRALPAAPEDVVDV